MPGKRKSIRLPDFDYSTAGAYYVTICAHHRECIFGEINENIVGADLRVRPKNELNEMGKMVEKWWNELRVKFTNVILDEYIIMPNHLHGILIIRDNGNTNAFGKWTGLNGQHLERQGGHTERQGGHTERQGGHTER
ncbi:hypothetical protein JW933_10510, partial [candidate division FCPU426 bacterium]|nr:hypothetical protein [candidate division FCPU426 bacterium]